MKPICLLSLVVFCSLLPLAVHAKDSEPPLVPTHANVAYGDHERNVLDFWQAEGTGPRPLVVRIHGGGWTSGDKSKQPADKKFLSQGISYAAINYRYSWQATLPAPVHDAARAIQFLRSKAEEWNIDKDRIALIGSSAGACTSMWLLFHDDLADPNAADPVLRESTRVTAAAAAVGQTSIDPKVIEGWLGPNVLKHGMIHRAVGEKDLKEVQKNYNQHRDLFVKFSAYNHVDANDPPLMMNYGGDMTLPSKDAGHGIHHPVYGVKLKKKSDELGHECHLIIQGQPHTSRYKSPRDFLEKKLLGE